MLQHLLTNTATTGEGGGGCSSLLLTIPVSAPKPINLMHLYIYTLMETWAFCNVGMPALLYFSDIYMLVLSFIFLIYTQGRLQSYKRPCNKDNMIQPAMQ